MSDKAVTYTSEGAVGIITLDKRPANSYDLAFMQDLEAAIEAAAQDDTVKVALVQSAQSKFFCAGADVKALKANAIADNMKMIDFAQETLAMISLLPKVFIAVINGHALGGGLEIALACDLRFAGDGEFTLGLPEVSLGILPGNGGTQRLPRLIGKGRALSMMITGETVGPQDALALGIVDRVFPTDSLWDESLAFAQELAGGATLAIAHIKRAVHEGLNLSLADGLKLERDLFAELLASEDGAEGIAAFTERRQAEFTGR
jgi:enoyl-CoA hydratase/carnithine racemase